MDSPGAILVVRPVPSCPDLERVATSPGNQEAGWGAPIDIVQEHKAHNSCGMPGSAQQQSQRLGGRDRRLLGFAGALLVQPKQ